MTALRKRIQLLNDFEYFQSLTLKIKRGERLTKNERQFREKMLSIAREKTAKLLNVTVNDLKNPNKDLKRKLKEAQRKEALKMANPKILELTNNDCNSKEEEWFLKSIQKLTQDVRHKLKL